MQSATAHANGIFQALPLLTVSSIRFVVDCIVDINTGQVSANIKLHHGDSWRSFLLE